MLDELTSEEKEELNYQFKNHGGVYGLVRLTSRSIEFVCSSERYDDDDRSVELREIANEAIGAYLSMFYPMSRNRAIRNLNYLLNRSNLDTGKVAREIFEDLYRNS